MKTTRIIKKDIRRYWWLPGAGLTAIFCLELMALYSPQLIKRAVDLLASGEADTGRLLGIGGSVVALACGVAVLRAVGRPSLLAFGYMIERDLRHHFFSRVIGLSGDGGSRAPAGDIMARATYDINNIRLACGYGFQAAVNSVLTLALALAYMIFMSPLLTLLAFLPMVAIPWLTTRQSKRFHHCHRAIQESFSALTEESRDSVSAIRLIKVFNLVSIKDRQFDRLARRHLDNNMTLARVSALYLPVMTLITHLSQAVVWGLGGAMAVTGMLSAGDIVAFSAYLVMLRSPLVYSGYLINLYQRAKSSAARVDGILEEPPGRARVCRAEKNDPRPGVGGDILIKNLSFTYPGENRPALEDISLCLPSGATTAIVGPVGSGKSTLLQLLTRIQDPPPNSIFIGNTDILHIPPGQLRSHMGMSVQEPFLFSDTIRENLLMARPAASEGELWEAVEATGLSREIRGFPEQLDTILGERGQRLSGGQKARLCLARTILQECPRLLLDDPLSAVDNRVEALILDSLSKRMGAGCLIVSHRPQSLAFSHRIAVLEEGRLNAQGSHKKLIETSRLYRRLMHTQHLASRLSEGI